MELVVPSNIPWKDFKGKTLEELVFWLLDDLGAKDLTWRKGGEDTTSSDGGRDIEAVFYVTSPDGEMEKQKCWFEIKGRSKTVEASAVREAIINVSGRQDVDVFYFVTNTQFSNPTRDWIDNWQNNNPRPKIRLWDKESLEKMVIKHPNVIIRMCSEALSDQGKLEAYTTRFWSQLYFVSRDNLDYLWKKHNELEWSSKALYTIIAGEIANGNICNHRWLNGLSDEMLLEVTTLSLLNSVHLYFRSQDFGQNSEVIIKTTSYILLVALIRLPYEIVYELTYDPWLFNGGEPINRNGHELIIRPILEYINLELSDACCTKCERFLSRETTILNEQEIETYWNRFNISNGKEEIDKQDDGQLIIEVFDKPCSLGLIGETEKCCPLSNIEDKNLKDELSIYKKIIEKQLDSKI